MSEPANLKEQAAGIFGGLKQILNPAKDALDFAGKGKTLPLVGSKVSGYLKQAEGNKMVDQLKQLHTLLGTLEQEAKIGGPSNPSPDTTPGIYTRDEFTSAVVRIGNVFGLSAEAAKAAIKIDANGFVTYTLNLNKSVEKVFDVDSDFGAGKLLSFQSGGKINFGAKVGLNVTVGHDNSGFYIDTSKKDAATKKLDLFSLEGMASFSEFSAETYTDANNNGKYDPAEVLTKDVDGDKNWDAGDTFTDADGDGIWDKAEDFVDRNKNSKYDGKIEVKPTNLSATLGFLNFKVSDQTVGKDKNGKEQYDAYLKLGAELMDKDTKDNKLYFGEIKFGSEIDGKTLLPVLQGRVNLDLGLKAQAPESVQVSKQNLADLLPSIDGSFKLQFAGGLDKSNKFAELTNTDGKTKGINVAFKDVKINLGSFLGKDGPVAKVLGPVAEVAKLVGPVAKVLNTKIAPLELLGAPSTLLELVGAPKDTVYALDMISEAADFIKKLDKIQKEGAYKLGDFQLVGDPTKDPGKFDASKTTVTGTAKLPDAISGFQKDTGGNAPAGPTAKSGDKPKTGFDFPLLTDPKSAALALLLGKPGVDLITYRLPELNVNGGPSWSFPLPLPIPVPVFVDLAVNVGLKGRLAFGLDTTGFADFRKDTQKPALLLNGLYISDWHPNAKGKLEDLPELELFGGISVAAKAGIPGLLSIGIGAGIEANIGLDLKGNNGKWRPGDAIASAGSFGGFLKNSFEFKGKLSAYAFVEASVLLWNERFELGRFTLLEFPSEDAPTAINNPRGAFEYRTNIKNLYEYEQRFANNILLNVGPRRNLSDVPEDLGPDETVTIIRPAFEGKIVGEYALQVDFSNQKKEFVGIVPSGQQAPSPNWWPKNPKASGFVVGDFRDGNDRIELAGTGWKQFSVRTPISVDLGAGDDTAMGGLGGDFLEGEDGDDFLSGDMGRDTLWGGAGDDLLMPGARHGLDFSFLTPGGQTSMADLVKGLPVDNVPDIIDGGKGTDRVSYRTGNGRIDLNLATGIHAGAALGDVITDVEQFEGSAFDDAMRGGNAAEVLEGFDGNDVIGGGKGDDFLDGGQGADFLDGGEGSADVASYIKSRQAVNVGLAAGFGKGKGGEAQGDSLVNIEFLIGSQYSDTLVGNDSANRIHGGKAGENFTDLNGNGQWDQGEKFTDTNKSGQWDRGEKFEDANENGKWDGETFIDDNKDKKWNPGIDSMVGGKGNDTYTVDNANDAVVEAVGEGNDTVESMVTYQLPANVEQLVLTGLVVEKLDAAPPAKKTAVTPRFGGLTAINGNILNALIGPKFLQLVIASKFPLSGTGNALANTLVGNNGANLLEGREGNDSLVGNDGNDFLNGGQGADRMVGGLGNDTYVVDLLPSNVGGGAALSGDTITENRNEGIDTVLSSVTFTLPTEAEILRLTGTAAISGTGNVEQNTLEGNSAANTLRGGGGRDSLVGNAGDDFLDGFDGNDPAIGSSAGPDTLRGGQGNDTYIAGDTKESEYTDTIIELANEGTDLVLSPLAAYTLPAHVENLRITGTAPGNGTGNNLNNAITGNDAANILDGGVGSDTLVGGKGNDTYVVDGASDIITELAGEGTDEVRSSLTLTLGNHLENLVLVGQFAVDGTGNAAGNRITGNNSVNLLDGGAGADTMVGGAGNDTYIVADANDVVIEVANAGADEVRTSVDYTLTGGAHVEDLVLTGTAVNCTGNELVNVIRGNAAANVLDGGAGQDTLIGGAGDDTYVVDNAGDMVIEAADGGIDTVRVTWKSHSLDNEVENLELVGVLAAGTGTGNELANRITGRSSGQNQLYGGGGNDTLIGGTGVDALLGNDGDDSLVGGAGDDVFDGGAGNDTMVGGAGDDFYAVDNEGDVVVEESGEGSDTIRVLATYTLNAGSELENIVLGGDTEAYHATGNDGNNSLLGNDGANSLAGGAGNDTLQGSNGMDTLIGGAGDDVYVLSDYAADGTPDLVVEESGGGTDTVQSFAKAYVLPVNVENLELTGSDALSGTGNELANRIAGNSNNNTLNGGAGADTLEGGSGDDTYLLEGNADTIVEVPNGGIDMVRSSVTFTLGSNVENLTLVGSDAINGAGNELANQLGGNDAANLLNGGLGSDAMVGGLGNDTYVVDNAGDSVIERDGQGTDSVRSSISYTLPGGVENLVLTDSAPNGTGNSSGNTLVGNDFSQLVFTRFMSNALIGMGGNDSLSGEGGNDTLTGCVNSSTTGGRGEIDTLTGGSGSDLFVLGARVGTGLFTASARFYEDGVQGNAGRGDYALITDFDPELDKLQLAGASKDYFTNTNVGIAGLTGTCVWREDGGIDELIAVIQPAPGKSLTTTNTVVNASFV